MLRYVLFDTTCFGSGDSVEETELDLCWMLEALTQRNHDYLRRRRGTPRLYKSGVCYKLPNQYSGDCEEVRLLRTALGRSARQRDVSRVLEKVQEVLGGEVFRDIGRILENGGGDCDNLACWRAAELRLHGIAAQAYMTKRESFGGGVVYHALVRWPPFGTETKWTDEDPSLLLGMGGEKRAAQRAEEIRKNIERCDILKKYGPAPVAASIEDVLGLRRAPDVPANLVSEIERILRTAA